MSNFKYGWPIKDVFGLFIGLFDAATDLGLYFDLKNGELFCKLQRQGIQALIIPFQLIFSIIGVLTVVAKLVNLCHYLYQLHKIRKQKSMDQIALENKATSLKFNDNSIPNSKKIVIDVEKVKLKSSAEIAKNNYVFRSLLCSFFAIQFEDVPQICLAFIIKTYAGFGSKIQLFSWYGSLMSFIYGIHKIFSMLTKKLFSDRTIWKWSAIVCSPLVVCSWMVTIALVVLSSVVIGSNYAGINVDLTVYVVAPIDLDTLHFNDSSIENIFAHFYSSLQSQTNLNYIPSKYYCDPYSSIYESNGSQFLYNSINDSMLEIVYQENVLDNFKFNVVADDTVSSEILNTIGYQRMFPWPGKHVDVSQIFYSYLPWNELTRFFLNGYVFKFVNFYQGFYDVFPYWKTQHNTFYSHTFAMKMVPNYGAILTNTTWGAGNWINNVDPMDEVFDFDPIAQQCQQTYTDFSVCLSEFGLCDDFMQCVASYMIATFYIDQCE
eukprot:249114_1